jgi:hypothetical protein|tara:strand:+ start:58 stop:315 length:258 start_codon:yes stop_codon:yes gene_type:complete
MEGGKIMALSKKHYKKIAELISDNIVIPNKNSNVNYIAIGFIWKLAEYFKTENINFNTDIFFKAILNNKIKNINLIKVNTNKIIN